ncbi:mannitol dehydrogenase family protein [Cognatiyoonia sp. IB215446]|uniref:mannitol dehydrogenase family protein n=1 Tax=Cognatiyoonia sp. IB215446 TaxID=3097355 RepID=UPI002A0DB075|nr:mannitol dehydrogenase family protein [Cognatiyoonia sp. IB215446]MDX8349292.1 mannitol dehydrogenase family protein [Cognatiyoonia sp. IB215446]
MTVAQRPIRIVHLGLGAFYRAHACTYLQKLEGWGVLGVSLRSASVRDAMRPRNYRYTAAALTPDGMDLQQIDVVQDMLVAPENPVAVIAALADPAVSLVTLTVTEKGYCHDPATGTLNAHHIGVKSDITNVLPRTALGFLVRGLQARRAAGLSPFTVLSCDNLPTNGAVARRVTIELARHIDPDLADWISAEVAFPASMVDRIVPATTAEDVARITALSGQTDAAPVVHEPFTQWIITDEFAGDLPDLAAVGAQIVPDIAPFERMKLRMLNGAHSALAYLGSLAGFETVADAVADDSVACYLRALWHNEVIPTLTAPPNTRLEDYAGALLSRFANRGIQHRLSQIAMDGSQKLPQRFLGTIEDRLAQGGRIDALLIALAGWIACTANQSNDADPMAADLRDCHTTDPRQTVRNILSLSAIFKDTLSTRLMDPLSDVYTELTKKGARNMLTAAAH